MRIYIVGHFRYNTMNKSEIACVPEGNIDVLPPTMYPCMKRIEALNRREAIKLFREKVAPNCTHQ